MAISCRHTSSGVSLDFTSKLCGSGVGVYLRETKRRNRDGSTVSYLQLAHSERHPVTGVPQAKVIHNFGRADAVDRDGLARLVSSISRFLDPAQATAAAHAGQIEVLDSRRFGGAWVADQLWERLGVGAALRRVAADRRLDAEATERVLLALVAQRALAPGSKLAATRWPSGWRSPTVPDSATTVLS